MNRRCATISTACLAAAVLAQQCLPASAFRAPLGAVSGNNKLMKGVSGNPDDLSFSPVLLQMAKLIGRIGLTPGFFLQNDGLFSDSPSIDLRTLLLYQAGLIKIPVHLADSKKEASDQTEPVPTLSVPAIPEPNKEMSEETPSDLPSLAAQPLPREPERDHVVSPKANVGAPEKISFAASRVTDAQARPASAPLVSIDVTRLQADLGENGHDKPEKTQIVADLPHLAMTMPRTNSMPFITRNMFRLWTWRDEQTGTNSAGTDLLPARPANYSGTFVIATTGAIKSITGRHFTISPGRLLANNQGGELLFQSNLADISVEPEATAVVENSAGNVKVYALESGEQHAVVVTIPGKSPKSIKLEAGEALIVADHALTDADFAGSHIEARSKVGTNMARGRFAVAQYVQQELMLKSNLQSEPERYQALTSLKRRVSEPPSSR